MEQNIKKARTIALSIWVTQLVVMVLAFIWFIVIFVTIMGDAMYSSYTTQEIEESVASLSTGPAIATISVSAVLLTLSIWLYMINKTLTEGKVKKHINSAVIITLVTVSYDIIVTFITLFVFIPGLTFINTAVGFLAIAGWVMMIMSFNYLKNFTNSNTEFNPIFQQPQWNPNMQFQGQQQNPWMQNPVQQSNDAIAKIEQANTLREKGLITEEEFQRIKAEALSKL